MEEQLVKHTIVSSRQQNVMKHLKRISSVSVDMESPAPEHFPEWDNPWLY